MALFITPMLIKVHFPHFHSSFCCQFRFGEPTSIQYIILYTSLFIHPTVSRVIVLIDCLTVPSIWPVQVPRLVPFAFVSLPLRQFRHLLLYPIELLVISTDRSRTRDSLASSSKYITCLRVSSHQVQLWSCPFGNSIRLAPLSNSTIPRIGL